MGNICGDAPEANDYEGFFQMLVTYLKDHDHNELATRLLENRDQVVTYLIKNNWTSADMNDHAWKTDEYGLQMYFGKMIGNKLISTNGVILHLEFEIVYISYFDQDGLSIKPFIQCDKDEFYIDE